MNPLGAPDGFVCHVLLIEHDRGLALVDTGLGRGYGSDPNGWFGPARVLVRPQFDPAETAVAQVRRLGHRAEDVTDIVLTHFDADHAGGLADFPAARVHVTAAENRVSSTPRGLVQRGRYLPALRAHGPRIVEHSPERGESWRGFARAVELTDISPDVVLLALPGHSAGHAAIAVRHQAPGDDHWVLHVGDSFYHRGQINGPGNAPRPLRLSERLIADDWSAVRRNHARLTELWRDGGPELLLVNAHDPALLAAAWQRAG